MTDRRGIPRRPIFWTLDQIADMLAISEAQLTKAYVWFEGQEVGPYNKRYLRAVDLERGRVHGELSRGRPRVWRVSEQEFTRWLSFHRLWIYEDPAVTYRLTDSPRIHRPHNEHRGTVVDIKLVDTPLEGTEEV